MRQYHLYFLRPDDRVGHIVARHFAGDLEAKLYLAGHLHEQAVELWEGSRLVARLPPAAFRALPYAAE